MDLLLSGSDKLLEIQTTNIDIVIKTKLKQAKINICNAKYISLLRVTGLNVEHISSPFYGVKETYSDLKGTSIHELKIPPLFLEQTDYLVTVRSKKGESLSFQSNSRFIGEKIGRLFDDDPTQLSGIINYGNNVGYSDLNFFSNGKNILSIRIEVYPSKISYKEDYKEIMTDINNIVNECILDFMKKTYQVFVPGYKKNDVPVVFFTVLQSVFNRYLQAINRILSVPHHNLNKEYEVVRHNKAKKTDSKSEKWLRNHPECLMKLNGRLAVKRVLAAEKRVTFDTQENQLVKYMLNSTVKKIEDFILRYKRSTLHPEKSILEGATQMIDKLRRFLAFGFLKNVSDYKPNQSMSLVFSMAPGYRELYKYFLMLQNGFSTNGDIFNLSVRETSQLYEYWCFIKLFTLLREHYKLKSPDIIKVDRKGVTIDLVKGRSSKVTFLNTKTGELINLAYNPSEVTTQTVNQRPDNVLEIEKSDSNTTYKYVFDAKYRIEMFPDGKYYPDSKPGPKIEDINTMHRYRDSIVYENSNSKFTFEKTMFGAYILFPYSNEKEYIEHRFYRSIESVNIGGLPFLPSATSLVTDLLNDLILDSSDSAFERTTLPIGIDDRIKTVEWDKRDVLIGLVSDKSHLDFFLSNRMYFTRRFNIDNLPIRYLALYEKGSGIRYYGEVISWEKSERESLPGKSNHSEICHVFKVKTWLELPHKIEKEEIGPFPVAYTNYFLLITGSTYSELRLKNEEEYRLFIELRRLTNTKIFEQNGDVAFKIGNTKIISNNNKIYLIKENSIVVEFEAKEFRKKPHATLKIIKQYIKI